VCDLLKTCFQYFNFEASFKCSVIFKFKNSHESFKIKISKSSYLTKSKKYIVLLLGLIIDRLIRFNNKTNDAKRELLSKKIVYALTPLDILLKLNVYL